MNMSAKIAQGATGRASAVEDKGLLRRERPLHMGVVERNNRRCWYAQSPLNL